MDNDLAADRVALADLVAEYARSVDRGDPEAVAACFAPDGVLRITDVATGKLLRERVGREEIAKAISKMSYDSTFHFLGQHQATLGTSDTGTKDTGTGETYCIAHHLTLPDGGDGAPATDYIMYIRYQDQFVRLDEGWRLAVRELHVDWTETRQLQDT